MKPPLLLAAVLLVAAATVSAEPPDEVAFKGLVTSPIAEAVAIPAGRAFFLTSGTGPVLLDQKAPVGDPTRYGDTQTQGFGALRKIEDSLSLNGLSLKDVVYLRVYVVADKNKDGKFDYQGWFDAYAKFFGTKDNPIKPARSTVGVASLVNPDWLIEIEAVAVYPADRR